MTTYGTWRRYANHTQMRPVFFRGRVIRFEYRFWYKEVPRV